MIFVIHNMLCTVYSSNPCFSMAPSRDLSKLDVTNRRPHAERRTAIFELNLTEFFIATGDPTASSLGHELQQALNLHQLWMSRNLSCSLPVTII